jgi:hypothetical protein
MQCYSLFVKLPFDYWLDLKDPVVAPLLSSQDTSGLESESIYIGKYLNLSSDTQHVQDSS